eukprot:scaffold323498_cov15-Tisochrysis_lutea.AAC.1
METTEEESMNDGHLRGMEEGSKWMLAMCRDIGGNLLDDGLNGKRLNGWWPPARVHWREIR